MNEYLLRDPIARNMESVAAEIAYEAVVGPHKTIHVEGPWVSTVAELQASVSQAMRVAADRALNDFKSVGASEFRGRTEPGVSSNLHALRGRS